MNTSFSLQRTFSVARKESLHILRDPGTLFFAFFIPVLELFMLGYAIDTNVRHIRTVVLDLAQTQESRELIKKLEATQIFRVVDITVATDEQLSQVIRAGGARVGIKIPAEYSRQISFGMVPAQVLVLVDGSESSIAAAATSASTGVVLTQALDILTRETGRNFKVETRGLTLYNPDTRSANFFIPGLMVVMCQMMAIMLSANAIVREKENGTLEQLFMTPVRAGELIFGKLLPYLVLTLVEFCTILLLMVVVFQVPINGPIIVLLSLTLPFVFCFLGLGLWISTQVSTREAASQMAMGTMMPSIFLSGYVFPMDSMPWFFWYLAQIFPTTWLIDGARGVILRGASWAELWPHAVVLWVMGLTAFVASMLTFRKRLT